MPPRRLRPLPRTTVADLVSDLREEVVDLADEMPSLPAHESFGGQAAQTLEEFEVALTQIAEGAPDPQAIVRAALALTEPLKPIGDDAPLDPDAVIRAMLRPRPV